MPTQAELTPGMQSFLKEAVHDELANKYLGTERYPWRRPGEQRVILTIQPQRIYAIGVDGGTWPRPDA